MSEYDHFAVLFVELPDRLPEAVLGLVSFSDHFGVEAVFLILNDDRIFCTVKTLCFFVFEFPKMAEALIFQYLVEPWKEFVVRAEPVDISVGLEKSFLGQVQSVLPVADVT